MSMDARTAGRSWKTLRHFLIVLMNCFAHAGIMHLEFGRRPVGRLWKTLRHFLIVLMNCFAHAGIMHLEFGRRPVESGLRPGQDNNVLT